MKINRWRARCIVIEKPFTLGYYMYAYGESSEEAETNLKHKVRDCWSANLDEIEFKEIA